MSEPVFILPGGYPDEGDASPVGTPGAPLRPDVSRDLDNSSEVDDQRDEDSDDPDSNPEAVGMTRLSITRTTLVVGLLLVCAGLAAPAGATTMPYTTLPELVDRSELIVRGTVAGQHSFVDENSGRITTHTAIEVATTYFGDETIGELNVEQWGGTVDGRTLEIPGNAEFERGERVVLFLEFADGPERRPMYLVAMAQAKFHVESGEDGPQISRSPDVEYVDRDVRSGRLEAPISLASFESRLQSLIYARKKGGDDE